MTPRMYLEFSIKEKLYQYKDWVIRAFAVVNDNPKENEYVGQLYKEPFGYYFINHEGEKVIINAPTNKPLFTKQDVIQIGHSEVSCIAEDSIETTIGRLLLNLLVIQEPFNGRLPYINKPFTPDTVEKIVAPLLHDKLPEGQPKEDGVYYVDEFLKYGASVIFVEGLSAIFSHSVTMAGILPAPGRKEFKQALIKSYQANGRDFTDPVVIANFEDELNAFDTKYLKENDPSFGKFMTGKSQASRLKTFMTQGGEANNFINDVRVTPILSSLDEGMVLREAEFTAAANNIRFGSFSRGAETVNGGVTAKAIMNASDTWEITNDDCGTKLGVRRIYRQKNIHKLVGRTVIEDNTMTYIKDIEMAKTYVDKSIVVRSPQYCLKKGTHTCTVCAGKKLSKYNQGQIVPLMDVSSGIMKDSLKIMHNTKLVTRTANLDDITS